MCLIYSMLNQISDSYSVRDIQLHCNVKVTGREYITQYNTCKYSMHL